jgi:hypothetical protein
MLVIRAVSLPLEFHQRLLAIPALSILALSITTGEWAG